MSESELTVEDLIEPSRMDRPIYYGFDITADCNDNIFYISGQLLRVIRDDPQQDYIYCAMPFRYDNYELNQDIGLRVVWEGEKGTNRYGLEVAPRFQEGNFKDFLSN